ncbi:MAG: STAS domain-containing protein [Aggregatilineales bacterium]
MEINQRSTKGIDILTLGGRFDAYEVPTVVSWFEDHPQLKKVVVNLENVNFIDSSGLSALVKGLKRCRQNGGELYLCHLQQAVFIIFELTRLDKAFNIYADEAAAIKAFEK